MSRAWSVLLLGGLLLGSVMAVGCGSVDLASVQDVAEVEPVAVRVALDGEPRPGGGSLIVQAEFDTTGSIDLPEPVAVGLKFEADGPPFAENIGSRDVVTRRYVYRGPPGHYEVPPVIASWTSPEGEVVTGESTPLFFDIEVEPISVGDLDDIVEPSVVRDPTWVALAIVAVLGIASLFLAGLAFAFWPREARQRRNIPLPPHLAALAEWDAVRGNPLFTDEDKARELSLIFRRYAERVLRFEATAWTTSEILQHLDALQKLPEGNLPRAKRMLRATDRIKFAEDRPTDELIDELDADLRAFVDATRPVFVPPPTSEAPVEDLPSGLPWWVPLGVIVAGGFGLAFIEFSVMALSGEFAPLWLMVAGGGLVAVAVAASLLWRVR